jgi:hypothetical protein
MEKQKRLGAAVNAGLPYSWIYDLLSHLVPILTSETLQVLLRSKLSAVLSFFQKH